MKNLLLVAALLFASSAAFANSDALANAVNSSTSGSSTTSGRTSPPSSAELSRATRNIEMLDTNQDGKLSLEEFLAPVVKLFKKTDTNSDGFISVEELVDDSRKAKN